MGKSAGSHDPPGDAPPADGQPKVELHCHLDGIVDPPMVRALRESGVILPVAPEALEAALPVRDFQAFVDWYGPSKAMSGRLDLYEPVVAAHIGRLAAQRVVYAELMVASGELPLDPAAALDAMARFRAWIDAQEACHGGAVQVELLVAFGRNRPAERLDLIATRNLRLFEAGLLRGVALAGPEPGCPVAPFARVFERYREAGVPVEIHAAEWCGPESAWDALAHGAPRRLGHATHVFEDPRLVETLAERQVHLEMCPTSNLCTGSIARIEDHPIRHALAAGLDVGVNTDDPGIFGCSMTSEYALLRSRFGFTESELAHLAVNALRARFAQTLRGAAAALASAA